MDNRYLGTIYKAQKSYNGCVSKLIYQLKYHAFYNRFNVMQIT